mmetsp:Transcript_18619/g.53519  ORF Transcript_18619/g.53519 Transcript_18619/m.53519 type:complete len:407 (+) Transcript_18619:278-1498(+)
MTTITPPPPGSVGIIAKKGGSTSHAVQSPQPFYRRPLFLLKIGVYVSTGILQPIIIDTLRIKSCLGRKSLLLPTLAKTTGMALVGLLSTKADRSTLRHLLRGSRDFRHSLLLAAVVDLISGMMLTGGILITGSSIFVVLYNSCPAWTAILSKYFLGRTLTSRQWIGVLVVVLGLICNVFGTTEQLSGKGKDQQHLLTIIFGSGIVLLGCILHSAFFVLSDRSLRGKGGDCHGHSKGGSDNSGVISPPLWSSCLGSMEAVVMATYILTSVSSKGFQDEGISSDICPAPEFVKGFSFMLMVDAFHSAAFFLMLKQIGAVGSALLKGVQSVAVVILSAIFFCPQEEAQCLTTMKAISVILVLSGTFLYAAGSTAEDKKSKGGKISLQAIEKQRGIDELPSVEVESLLDT